MVKKPTQTQEVVRPNITENNLCFIIMPFSQTTEEHTEAHWNEHFDYIQSIIETEFVNKRLIVKRSKPLRKNILDEIIKDLITAKMVVADLTDLNPNVLWELGVRQSFRNGTITIAQKGVKPPFDLGTKAIIMYDLHHKRISKFRSDLIGAIEDCLTYPESSDSPVLEYISGRGTLHEIIHKEEIIRKIDALRCELLFNIDVMYSINLQIKENANPAGNKSTQKYVTVLNLRFGIACQEALIVTRYLTLEEEFYKRIYDLYQTFRNGNIILSAWNINSAEVEKELSKSISTNILETREIIMHLDDAYKLIFRTC